MINVYKKVVLITGVFFVLLTLWIFSVSQKSQATVISSTDPLQLTTLKFDNTKELHSYFQRQNFLWPINNNNSIPNYAVQNIPPDLSEIKDMNLRKTLFIRIMLPIIHAEQKRIRHNREILIAKLNRTGIDATNHEWFKQLLIEHNITGNDFISQREELLRQIDELPTTLVLAQAAIESAWGTSRFAIEGNSLFGQWTFAKGDGLVPVNRQQGKTHQVKSFESLQASVRSYFKNINRNNAYKELREYREIMRKQGKKLDAFELAEGLNRYSQKGLDYVRSVQNLMSTSEFELLSELEEQAG